MVPDMMFSKSKNDTSYSGTRKYFAQNVIQKKNEDCLRDADGHKLSPWELYHLSKVECNGSYLKKLGLGGSSIFKRESVCK